MPKGSQFNRKNKINLRKNSENLKGHMSGSRVGQKLPAGAKVMKDFIDSTAQDKLEDFKNGTLDLSTATPELRHAIEERLKKISK
jgi:hypothetical protein|tara:strand:- start:402 stop:656 length:255 start_codon:yes stop_codon:yes gene_type:complete